MSNQLNFSQQMDEVLKTLGDTRPRLLLHACCGPCSSAVLERLCRYFDITVLYYNPNTWPAEEYHRRGEELERFVAAAHPLGVTVVEDRYDPQEFYSAVAGPRKRAGARQSLHGLLSAADAPCGPVCRRARLRLVHHDPLHQPPQGRQAHQCHRAGAGAGVRREAPALRLQKAERLSALACSSRRNTASTGRTTAAVSSAQRPEASALLRENK